jgi:hypothetical protein
MKSSISSGSRVSERPVAIQGELQRAELKDAQLVCLSEGRMTLTGYEQIENERGQLIEYRQSWLVMLDTGPTIPELGKRKVSPNA